MIACLSPFVTGKTAWGKQKLLGKTIALPVSLGKICSPPKKENSPPS